MGIGIIQFTLTANDGSTEVIRLNNVLFLPTSAKNLISTSKWSEDRGDNCGVMSRQIYSTFVWDDDSKQKIIPHPSNCKIPLMNVNENLDVFAVFLSSHEHQILDKDSLLHMDRIEEDPVLMNKAINDQGTKPKGDTLFHKGDTVKVIISGDTKVCIVVQHFRSGSDLLHYKVMPHNMKYIIVQDPKDISAFEAGQADF